MRKEVAPPPGPAPSGCAQRVPSQHNKGHFYVTSVTYNTSSILATICSAHARSFSKVTRSLSLSTSSLVSSLSAKVSPMLLFCLRGTGGVISLTRLHSREFPATGPGQGFSTGTHLCWDGTHSTEHRPTGKSHGEGTMNSQYPNTLTPDAHYALVTEMETRC